MSVLSRRQMAFVATAVWAGIVLLLASNRGFYEAAMMSPYFAFALGGAAILHFAVRPPKDALPVAGLAGGLAVADWAVLGFPHGAWLVPSLSLIGMGSLLVLGARLIWASGPQRKLLACAFVPALLFVISEWFASDLLELTTRLHPRTLDLYLYSFEASQGLQTSFEAGRLFAHWPWLRAISFVFYIGLALPIALVYGGQLRKRAAAALPVTVAFLITGPLGVVFYNLFPANGQLYVFRETFPMHSLSMEQAARLLLEPIAIAGYRNAIPSLHMAWALLVWWNSRGLSRWIRALMLAFVGFTVLATLGSGEHYLVDLAVAFPFAVMVQALADYPTPWSARRRALPLLGGLLMTLAWFALLRFAHPLWWISPAVPWGFMAATVAASFALLRLQMTAPQAGLAMSEALPASDAAPAP